MRMIIYSIEKRFSFKKELEKKRLALYEWAVTAVSREDVTN